MNKIILSALAWICIASSAYAQTYSAEDLARRNVERRAVEAVIWGMPAVNYDLMLQQALKLNARPNQIVYWSRLPSWKNQTLTPNPDVVYLMPFINTKDVGPMVLDIPPTGAEGLINGNLDDAWQCALEDVGPAGVDHGRGGKFLILPPGYKDKVPDGFIVLRSDTYGGFALLRSIPKSGSGGDIARAVAYGKRVKLYPLAQAANPTPTTFVDAIDAVFDSTIPYDLQFFQSLDRFVQAEPWLQRDRAMIDQLKSIGIEKGKPFNPDDKTKAILSNAAREVRSWLEVRYEALYSPPYYEGRQWALPILPDVIEGQAMSYPKPDIYPIDGRGVTYSMAFIGAKRLGTGQYYLMTLKDREGQPLDGGKPYRLSVPPNAPVEQYWSATVYDRTTHAFIRDSPQLSRSSQSPGLQKNADGSVDIFFGPTAPEGKESNWVITRTGGQFEVMFRLYGPEKPLFDKTWKLPDVERISVQ